MQCIKRIENHRRRTGAGERGSDFPPDVSGLSDTEHDNFTARFEASLDQRHRARKILVEPFPQPLQLENFHVENSSRLFQVIHRALIVRPAAGTGKK